MENINVECEDFPILDSANVIDFFHPDQAQITTALPYCTEAAHLLSTVNLDSLNGTKQLVLAVLCQLYSFSLLYNYCLIRYS